jgi:hypothetical protein
MALKIDCSLRLPDVEHFAAKRKKTGVAIRHRASTPRQLANLAASAQRRA